MLCKQTRCRGDGSNVPVKTGRPLPGSSAHADGNCGSFRLEILHRIQDSGGLLHQIPPSLPLAFGAGAAKSPTTARTVFTAGCLSST